MASYFPMSYPPTSFYPNVDQTTPLGFASYGQQYFFPAALSQYQYPTAMAPTAAAFQPTARSYSSSSEQDYYRTMPYGGQGYSAAPTVSYQTYSGQATAAQPQVQPQTTSQRVASQSQTQMQQPVQEEIAQVAPEIEATIESVASTQRRQPVVKRQVIKMPAGTGKMHQIIRRLPTPTPDVIERVFIRKQPRDIINLIIERPCTPPALYKDSTIVDRPKRPIINPRVYRVPPRTPYQLQYQQPAPTVQYPQALPYIPQQPQYTTQYTTAYTYPVAQTYEQQTQQVQQAQQQQQQQQQQPQVQQPATTQESRSSHHFHTHLSQPSQTQFANQQPPSYAQMQYQDPYRSTIGVGVPLQTYMPPSYPTMFTTSIY